MAASDPTTSPPRCRLLELSGELRNNIYGHMIDYYDGATMLKFSTPEGRQRKYLQEAFSLAKTCKQLNHEYGSVSDLIISLPLVELESSMTDSDGEKRGPHTLYNVLKEKGQGPPEPPDYLEVITAFVKAIESLINGHLAIHKAQCVTVALGVVNKDDFLVHWNILQTPLRRLRKAVPEMRLSFDLVQVRGTDGQSSITLKDADVMRMQFEAVLSKLRAGEIREHYRQIARHILRTFFPLRYCQMLEAGKWIVSREHDIFEGSYIDV